jgi:D-tyrosyl-tRNA(Tyr) deacylase
MRAVLQRVSEASVSINGKITGQIGDGLLILLGISKDDSEKNADSLIKKIVDLRIFPDIEEKMNLSILDAEGSALIVSQFTLYADVRRGRRPSFTNAAGGETALRLYQYFVDKFRDRGIPTETGVFGAMMAVSLVNNGPVTIILDTDDLN